jgi:GNAT superfamily N-acetyltransferase
MNIRIKQLTENLTRDYLNFFDNIGFTDNPDWSTCYCTYFHHKGGVDEWNRTSKAGNRAVAIELIKNGALRGFLAYDTKTPIGFCNANIKTAYSFEKNRGQVYGYENTDKATVAIVCFIVAPAMRKRGVGALLLENVIEHYARKGIRRFEAYPAKDATGDAPNYHGPEALYRSHGFVAVEEFDNYTIMRRTEGKA